MHGAMIKKKKVRKSFRPDEWRRLHIKNLVIFICLHSFGLRRCEDKLSKYSIVNLK
jgi:hypothetical protein